MSDIGTADDQTARLRAALEHHKAGRTDEAAALYRQVLERQPDQADANHLLGALSLQAGDAQSAIDFIERAVAARPDFAPALNNLGNAFRQLGRPDEAVAPFRRALAATPDFAAAACNLGCALLESKQGEAAIEALEQAIGIDPDLVEAHSNLGNALTGQGRVDEAIAAYRRALDIDPGLAAVRSNLLLALNYATSVDEETLFAEHLAYDATQAATGAARARPRPEDGDPKRRLRIGYVSPDLRLHAIASFIMPPFIHHDRKRFELHAYYTYHLSDQVTEGFRGVVDHWTDAAGISDDDLAAVIRRDRIDILVDLAGHSAFNRLPVFARHPAPVQVTWIGYSNTTGLGAIDYRLTDAFYDPEDGREELYTETLVRLPTRLCFQPPADCPAVGPLPARSNGHVTFVSTANLVKLNLPLLVLWGRILAAVPDSRLVILNAGSQAAGDRIREIFADAGVDADRLTLEGRRPFADYLALHNHVDIGLDAYPFNGAATSYTAAWMGVPHVTWCGRRPCSRHGHQLFANMGLADLVAESADDYIDRAVALGRDIDRLEGLRDDLRPRMAASPVTDGAGQTRALEDAYRRMWTEAAR